MLKAAPRDVTQGKASAETGAGRKMFLLFMEVEKKGFYAMVARSRMPTNSLLFSDLQQQTWNPESESRKNLYMPFQRAFLNYTHSQTVSNF